MFLVLYKISFTKKLKTAVYMSVKKSESLERCGEYLEFPKGLLLFPGQDDSSFRGVEIDNAPVLALIHARERQCFRDLKSSLSLLKKEHELLALLRQKGVKFYRNPRTLQRAMAPPLEEIPGNVSWKVLGIFCKLHYVFLHCGSCDSASHRQLVCKCLQVKKDCPQYSHYVDIALNAFRWLEVSIYSHEREVTKKINEVSRFWNGGGYRSEPLVSPIKDFIEILKENTFLIDRELFRNPEKAGPIPLDADAKEFADREFASDEAMIKAMETVVQVYESKTEQFNEEYAALYDLLKYEAKRKGWKLDKIFENRTWVSLDVLRWYNSYGIRSEGNSRIPRPEEFCRPLEEAPPLHMLVDRYGEEFEHPGAPPSVPAEPVASQSDFLSDALKRMGIKDKGQSKQPRRQPQKRHKAQRLQPSSCKEAPPASLSSAPQPQESTSKQMREKSEVQKAKREVAPEKPAHAHPQMALEPFGVHVDDRADLEFQYADRVVRWAQRDRDVFAEDPQYSYPPYSEGAKKAIRFHHSFGRALLPVIIKLGKLYEKSCYGSVSAVSFTLPGDIEFPDRSFEKVVFTVTKDARTGVIFHMHATKKTILEIVMEYARLGYFAAHEEEEVQAPSCSSSGSRAQTLPDDGSRVTEVANDSVLVTQEDGIKLTVYPFPDL